MLVRPDSPLNFTVAALPAIGFLRLPQILGDRKQSIPPLIPISERAWYAGMDAGIYPKPVKLGSRAVAWRVEDIRALIDRLSAQVERLDKAA